MADPKLKTIMKLLVSRLEAITLGNGYRTAMGSRVIRGNYALDQGMWPGCVIRLEGRALDETVNQRSVINGVVIVNGYAEIGSSDPEDVAIDMLSDIQRSIELVDDTNLGGLLRGKLTWQSDSIIYPDNNDSGVSVQVEYNLPHVRWFGNPEK